MKIHIADSKYKLPDDFWRRYKTEIEKSFEEASGLLPFGSAHINFFVQPRTYDLIEETNDAAYTVNSEYISLAFDPTLDENGLEHIIETAKYSVFHEMNHAARWNIPIYHRSFMDSCIMEGLATVFTREHIGFNALWSQYTDDVTAWIREIKELDNRIDFNQYMYKHQDGRKWIGYKVGTYLIDQAMGKSGKTVIELTQLECADILKLTK